MRNDIIYEVISLTYNKQFDFTLLFYDGRPYHMENKSIDWFLYHRDLRHERVKILFCSRLS